MPGSFPPATDESRAGDIVLTIRPVERDDCEPWNELWDGYNAFYGRSSDTALPTEITETTWRRFFDSEEPMHALVADQDGRLVGFAHRGRLDARLLADAPVERDGYASL